MKLLLALVALAVIAGCSAEPTAEPVAPPSPELLDAVAAACHAPRDWLHIGPDQRPQLIVPKDAAYDRIACLHHELEKQGVRAKTGLIRETSR